MRQEKGWKRLWNVWEAAAKGKLFGMLLEALPEHPEPPPRNPSFRVAQRDGKPRVPLQPPGSGIIPAALLPCFPVPNPNSLLALRNPFPSPAETYAAAGALPASRWDASGVEGTELERWEIPRWAPKEAPASGMGLQGRNSGSGSAFPAAPAGNEALTRRNPAALIPDGLRPAAR